MKRALLLAALLLAGCASTGNHEDDPARVAAWNQFDQLVAAEARLKESYGFYDHAYVMVEAGELPEEFLTNADRSGSGPYFQFLNVLDERYELAVTYRRSDGT